MSKNKDDVKVSLVLLKKLVASLETTLETANTIAESKTDDNVNDYFVEMSKGTGIAAGIVAEASLLVADIRQAIRLNTSPASLKDDGLNSLLEALKGSGTPGAN